MSTIKKTVGFGLFFVFLGTHIAFAQEDEQKISDQELTKFTNTFEKLEVANSTAQQEMVKVVESEGLEMKRFNEIHVAYINPNMESNATPEEMKKHNRAMTKIEKMQEELQKKMDKIVEANGLSTKKYQKIATGLRDDLALRDRYKKVMKAKEK